MFRKVLRSFVLFFLWIFYSALAYMFYYYLFGTILQGIGLTNEYGQVVYEFVFENTYTDIANIVISLFLGGLFIYIKLDQD